MLLLPRSPNVGAEEFVVVLPMLRRRWVAVDQRHPLGQPRVLPDRLLQPVHSQHPGLVIVQAQTDLGNIQMIAEELDHGTGRGPPKGEVVAVPPVAPGQLHQRGEGQRVNGALSNGQPGTRRVSGQQSEVVPFVAALHVEPKIVPGPPQAGEPGAARYIFANKNTVLILAAFIERTGLDALPEQIRVDTPALQIGKHPGGEPAGLREAKGLWGLWRRPLRGRRRTAATQGLHRVYKVHPPYLNEIVQRGPAPDAPAIPAPLPVGDFKAVMGSGAVFVGTAPL